MTGNLALGDNVKAMFGAGSDLQIYHDGTDSYINDAASGNLKVITNGNGIYFQSSGGENLARFVVDGDSALYFNNSNKLATTATGVSVTGNVIATGTVEPAGDTAAGDNAAIGYTAAEGLILTGQGSTSDITLKNDADAVVFTVPTGSDDILFPDNAKILMGAGSDLQLFHNGSQSYIGDYGTGDLNIQGTDVKILSNDSELMADFNVNGAVQLYHNNALKLSTIATGVDVTGTFTCDTNINVEASSGYASIEVGGPSGAFIDFKSPFSDDYDGRIQYDVGGSGSFVFNTNAGNSSPIIFKQQNSEKLRTTATGITITGAVKPTTYQETYVAKSAASTVTCDLATATSFSLTMDQATTFAFSNPPGSGTAFSFTLFLTQHSSAVAITWPNTVDWAGGSAPDAAGNNEVQAYAFFTRDGGTTYYGFLGGTAIA